MAEEKQHVSHMIDTLTHGATWSPGIWLPPFMMTGQRAPALTHRNYYDPAVGLLLHGISFLSIYLKSIH